MTHFVSILYDSVCSSVAFCISSIVVVSMILAMNLKIVSFALFHDCKSAADNCVLRVSLLILSGPGDILSLKLRSRYIDVIGVFFNLYSYKLQHNANFVTRLIDNPYSDCVTH